VNRCHFTTAGQLGLARPPFETHCHHLKAGTDHADSTGCWHSGASTLHGWAITKGPRLEINSFPTDGASSGDKQFSEVCLCFAVRPGFPMSLKVVRCPYCVLGVQFRPLVPRLDGTFICEKCGHVSLADGTSFKCSCYRCGELHSSRITSNVSPVLKIKKAASG